jgi:fatty acid desaturase
MGSLGVIPLALGCVVNAVISYAFYTVHHDANHRAVSGRVPGWRWLDTVCGSTAAIPLSLSFPGFSELHLQHHAHSNDPRDPDIIMKGPLPAPSPREREAHRRMLRYSRLSWIVLLLSAPLGIFPEVLLLWWLPGRLAILALNVLFQWLPHLPHDSTDRFRNTRITTFRGSTWLLLQQDHHLIHHLYPALPWYTYRRVFRELRALLVSQGAVIEGRDDSPPGRIRLRVEAAA